MACPRFQFLSMPGYFPKDTEILIIGQNPGQLSKRASGWDDTSYSEEEKYSNFQQGYAKGLYEAPIGQWIQEGLKGYAKWSFTNIIKCRTPDNSVPSQAEIEQCRPWLRKQIRHMDPKIIITLGTPAFNWFGLPFNIDHLRGRAIPLELPFWRGILMPMYHPAYHRYVHDKFTIGYLRKAAALLKNETMYNIVMTSQSFTPVR